MLRHGVTRILSTQTFLGIDFESDHFFELHSQLHRRPRDRLTHAVFGSTSPYWPSLVKTYGCYSLSLGLSTLINDIVRACSSSQVFACRFRCTPVSRFGAAMLCVCRFFPHAVMRRTNHVASTRPCRCNHVGSEIRSHSFCTVLSRAARLDGFLCCDVPLRSSVPHAAMPLWMQLNEWIGLNPRLAWVGSLLATGIINYYTVSGFAMQ